MKDVLLDIFLVGDLGADLATMAVIYLDRLFAKVPGLCLDVLNWKKLILGSLILASKVWDDATIWNEDFLPTLPCLTIEELGMAEHQLLKDLNWDVSIDRPTFSVYQMNLLTLKYASCHPDRKSLERNRTKTSRRRRNSLPTPRFTRPTRTSFETSW
jgi:hypothetical protein